MTYKIGIDAGGTHTTAEAYDQNGNLLTKVETGQGNVNADYEEAMANIKDAIRQIQAELGPDCEKILAGIAGVSVTGEYAKISQELANTFNVPSKTITDSAIALYRALKGKDGILTIAGTGSVVNGLQNGHIIAVGGYGHLLGDEGSGYAISIAALKKALNTYDQGKTSPLTEMFTRHFNVNRMEDCNALVYRMDRPQIGKLALLVSSLANQGDSDAILVLEDQADLLAHDILMCLDRFTTPKPMDIAFTGSVLTKNEVVRKRVEADILAKYPDANFIISDGGNASGVLYDEATDYTRPLIK
ncbi:N-acetylglucosamine kinase [Lactobacillus psittaci]|uniref:N-acetylglucosamine kinase n=1 Tax=Lactobacillus psittaci DSM 15354 TaxID=1122152 RepID=A0A0R1S2J6_9LACO|nr:BadF/BadG/BcrA/BcrD ATPase family protein [Lactobacillus psittaci]KRL61812.1 N-acetylglucosamine kinase [Lactobacillus psittaci DSM 15354]